MKVNMSKFWDLLKESVITQSMITIVVVLTWAYLTITGQPVPTELTSVLWVVLGFFFGAKMGFSQGSAARSHQPKAE